MNEGFGSCCEDFAKLDFSKMSVPSLPVIWVDGNFWVAAIFIVIHPAYWIMVILTISAPANVHTVSQHEYKTKRFSRMLHSSRVACAIFAVSIIILGLVRDYWFSRALTSQPSWFFLQRNYVLWTGHTLVVLGAILVVTSFCRLGFFGTYLGDHFGILMSEKVTAFPFNILNNPMYVGATLAFLGSALVKASFSGLLLTNLVIAMYWIASRRESEMLRKIYSSTSNNKKDNKKTK